MEQGTISVVICTYNGEKYIDEQLSSIIHQSRPADEIIIIDDCSTDGTYTRLQKWATTNSTIKLFRNEKNIGFNRNFEKAIALATCLHIAISDQDDFWLPDKLKLLEQALDADCQAMLVHCRSVRWINGVVDDRNHKLHRHFSGNDTRKLLFFNHINGHNMMFRKALTPFMLPIPQKMFYDWWIAVVATTKGRIISVDKTLVYHRIHHTNAHFNNKSAIVKNEPDHDEVLKVLNSIKELNYPTRNFLVRFLPLVEEQAKPGAKFNIRLFRFLFKNRKIIFGHKIRSFKLFSDTKNAFKYAAMNFRGAGI